MTTTLFDTASTSATSAAATSTSVAGSDTSDMFTKLLVAQIQNQDPLSPTDPADFVNQLAQLSQTESMDKLSTLTSANNSVLQSMQVLALGAQVGAHVTVNTASVTLDGDSVVDGSIALASNSTSTTLTLTGTDGVKHAIALGTLAAGTAPLTLDPAALGLPAGSYTMSVATSSGEVPTVDIAGTLASVRLSAGGAIVLNVSHVGEVAPATLTGFTGAATTLAVN